MQVRKVKLGFSTGREVCGSDRCFVAKMCPSAIVIRVQDGALAKEYAASSTTLVVVEVCLSHVPLTSALHVCDTEHCLLAMR